MGKISGFLEYKREVPTLRPVAERIKDYKEIQLKLSDEKIVEQAARCMDCGTPFCHSACPLGNMIPEFNDFMYRKSTDKAYKMLLKTNPFPEFTGRVCPAPCEDSCVLNIDESPTTIKNIEKTIAEKAYEKGYVTPQKPEKRTGKRVAVIGSGPAGLAAAWTLNRAGHWVVVFERADRIGGLLRYGIPDFKLEKEVLDRRIKVLQEEGIAFKTSTEAGKDISTAFLLDDFDAIILCGGSTVPRSLNIPGIQASGIHPAMDFLTLSNRKIAGDSIPESQDISATGKNIIVIGGGDTGADCVGTSVRQGAKSITQLELMPRPSDSRHQWNSWPQWGRIMRSSTSHDEGCERQRSVLTKEFTLDADGKVKGLIISDIEWEINAKGAPVKFTELPGTQRELPCDLAFLAIGFAHPEKGPLINETRVDLEPSGNVKANNYRTSNPKVFAAGDMRRGQSLVVWALAEGRDAAKEVNKYLMKS